MKRLFIVLFLLGLLPVVLYAREFNTVAIKTDNAGTIFFKHDVHLARLNNNCTACHNSLFKVLTAENPTATMADMEKGLSCGACHNNVTAFPLGQCTRCHVTKEVPIDIPNFGVIVFSHNFHLKQKQNFSCSDCHNGLFRAATDNPNKTMAQMEQGESCGGCHDGEIAFTVKANCTRCHIVKDINFTAGALFPHNVHLNIKFKCQDCHTRLFVAGPGSKRYTMEQMTRGHSCGACHEGKFAFSVAGDCARCHKGTKDIVFKKTDAVFSHSFHLEMYKCGDCHSSLFVGGANSKRYTMADMEKGQSCGACHDGKTGFSSNGSCNRCHKSTREIEFVVPDAGKAYFSHDVHQSLFKCDECHGKIFPAGGAKIHATMSDMQKGKSCGACHDGKKAFTVSSNCGKCHPVQDITFTGDARFSHTKHLENYGCYDCHKKFFNAGPDNRRWRMAEMEQGNSCGGCHNAKDAFSVKGDCNRCHRTTIQVTFKTAAAGDTVFSHRLHLAMYKCDDCHNAIFTGGKDSQRYKMADMEKGKSCGACHDGSTAFTVKENCQKCHPVKEVTFKDAAAKFSHTFHTGLYRCEDCHTGLFNPTADNRRWTMTDMEQGKSCGSCHEGKTAFNVNGSCEKCHTATRAVKYDLPQGVGTVLFSHKVHLGKGYSCATCHNKIVPIAGPSRKPVKMKEMEEGKFCGACHGFSMAFGVADPKSCGRCHEGRMDNDSQMPFTIQTF